MAASDSPETPNQDLGELYEIIAEEWSGKGRHEGLYLISLDEAGGDLLEARLIYAQKRLLQLTET